MFGLIFGANVLVVLDANGVERGAVLGLGVRDAAEHAFTSQRGALQRNSADILFKPY